MRTIQLAGKNGDGKSASVSEEDYEFLSQWTWCLIHKGYAIRTDRTDRKKSVYMHIEIAKRCGVFVPGLQVDHRDGNKLNNTRNNLRAATNQQNQANVGLQKNNRSGFKGVTLKKGKTSRPWVARIGVGRHRIHLGYFQTTKEAHEAYSRAAVEHFGEFARY